ncbi:MAG: fibronectin type III domain-containing protein [Bacteroidia bacterium]|nr:fibronectin type III domain-containing protein [Bacteroidia bacterium]
MCFAQQVLYKALLRLLLLGIFCLSSIGWGGLKLQVVAQNVSVPGTGSDTRTLCSGTISDPGGTTSNYFNNANGRLTIFPQNPCQKVRLEFIDINTDSNNDIIRIYNGPTTSDNLIATLWGSPLAGGGVLIYASTHFQGALTIEFISDGSGVARGFLASVSCFPELPLIPQVTAPTLCGAGSATISVQLFETSSRQVRLFSASSGGTPLAIAAAAPYELATPTINTTTQFYVEAFDPATSCASERIPVTVTVRNRPEAPTAADLQRCGIGSVTITVTLSNSSGIGVRLFSQSAGGTILAAQNSPPFILVTPSINSLGNTQFYLESYELIPGGCSSQRVPVNVTVLEQPDKPSIQGQARCGAGTFSFSFSPSLEWDIIGLYTQPAGGIPVAEQTATPYILTVNVTTTTTYYLETKKSSTNCASARSGVTLQINPLPSTPTISNVERCGRGAITFTSLQSPTFNELRLFLQESGGTPLTISSTSPYSLSAEITTTTSFYIESYNTQTGCASATRVLAIATLREVSEMKFDVTHTCSANDTSSTLSYTGTALAGATFSWNCDGCLPANPTGRGPHRVKWNTLGNKRITLTIRDQNGCTQSKESLVLIGPPTNQNVLLTSNSPICEGQTLKVTAPFVAGATYNWSIPIGQSPSTNEIILGGASIFATGTYNVVINVPGCAPLSGSTRVTIQPNPNFSLGHSGPVCEGGTLSLTAENIPGALYRWAGPNNFASTEPNPIINTVSLGAAGVYTLTVTQNGCSTTRVTSLVTVTQLPSTPSIRANTPLCTGLTLKLETTEIPGVSYLWQGPNGWRSTLKDPIITGVTTDFSGRYTLSVTAPGCKAVSNSVDVIVNRPPSVSINSNSPICAGSSPLLLTANFIQDALYNWRGPNNFSSNAQNPQISPVSTAFSGLYVLEVTVPGCAPVIATTNVVVNPFPAVTLSGNTPLCAGQSLNLSATLIQGATYRWKGPNTEITTTEPTLKLDNMTSASAGIYQVEVNQRGCVPVYVTLSVAVNTLPLSFSVGSNSPLCSGNTLVLTASSIPGAIYNWSGPNGFSSTQQNPVLINASINAAGRYTAVVTVPGCAGVLTNSVEVEVISTNLVAGSNSPVCAGNSLSLTAGTTANVLSYSWRGPAGFASSEANPVVPNVNTAYTGTYTLTINVAGCGVSSVTVPVTVNNPPAVRVTSNSPVCTNSTLSFSASNVANATYSWIGPNNFSSNTPSGNISFVTTANSGIYTLTVTVPGCPSFTETYEFSVIQRPATALFSGGTQYCVGDNLIQTISNPEAGASYTWIVPGRGSFRGSTLRIDSVSLENSGTYQVISVIGICSTTTTRNITINPLPLSPSISSNSPVCEGATINLTAIGTNIFWQGPNNFVATTSSASLPATLGAAGHYKAYAIANGCTSAPATLEVVVNRAIAGTVASTNAPVCVGQDLHLRTPEVQGASYLWQGPGGFSSNLRNVTLSNVESFRNGVYTLTVTPAGCPPVTTTISVEVNSQPKTLQAFANLPVCAGDTLRLSATVYNNATYEWNGPGLNATGQNLIIPNVSTGVNGVHTLTLTVAGCRPITTTLNVEITPLPATPLGGSNAPVCSGGTLSLTTPPDPSITYYWRGPQGFEAQGPRAVINNVTPSQAGTYTLVAIANGCTSRRAFVNASVINTPVKPNINTNSPLCLGQTLNLSTTPSPGLTYLWSGPNGFSFNQPTGSINSVTAANAGVYSLVAFNGGCASEVATARVIISTPPSNVVATNNGPLCAGSQLNLGASFVSEAIYEWQGPNGFTAFTINPTLNNVTTLNSGEYTLQVTVPGCNPITTTTRVIIHEVPFWVDIITNSPLCAGDVLTLSAPIIEGAAYLWNGPNNFSATNATPTRFNVSTANAGSYNVLITIPGCNRTLVASTNVIINQSIEPVATNNGPICENSRLILNVTSASQATYQWEGPAGFAATGQTQLLSNVTVDQAGTYTVTVSIPGCPTRIATTNVVINPALTNINIQNNSPICSGQTLLLSADEILGVTYQWRGPNNFTSSRSVIQLTNASPSVSGVYSLVVTPRGCPPLFKTTLVTVEPTPVRPSIILEGSPCVGSAITMSIAAPISAFYSWSGPNNFAANGIQVSIPSLSVSNAGVYSVVAISGNCTSEAGTRALQVLLPPLQPLVGNNGPLCPGQTLNLTATPIPGLVYAWSGPNNFKASSNNVSISNVTSLNAGVYSLVTIQNGCSSSVATTAVTVREAISASAVNASTPVCTGSQISLTAPFNSMATYNWQGPNGFVASTATAIRSNVTLNDGGIYTLTAVLNNCTTTATVRVTVNATPAQPSIAAPRIVCKGSSLLLQTSAVPNARYMWNGPGGFVDSVQNATVRNPQSGIYSLALVVNGCTSSTATVSINVNETVVSISANPLTICAGETTTLTFVAVGTAPWALNYQANGVSQTTTIPAFGTPNFGQQLVTVRPTQTTTYVLTSVTDGSGCTFSLNQSIVVNVQPLPSNLRATNNSPKCVGASVQLNVNTIANASYLWRGPGGFISEVQNPVISNVQTANTGVYSVYAIVGNCTSVAATTQVLVTPLSSASISGSYTLCVGQPTLLPVTLNGTPPWSLTYQVGTSAPVTANNLTSSPANISVTIPEVGNTTVTLLAVQDGNGCTSGNVSGSASVRVINRPVITVVSKESAICGRGGSVLVTATGGSGSYVYAIESLNLSNTNGVFTGLPAGSYTITARDGNCSGAIVVTIDGNLVTSITSTSTTMNTITVTWQILNGASGYNIRYRVSGSGAAYQQLSNVAGPSATITGLQPSTTYEVSVQPICPGGTLGEWSSSVSATTQSTSGGGTSTTCSTPSSLSAFAVGSTTATLAWTPSPGVACYVISYGLLSVSPSNWTELLVPGSSSSQTLTNLLPSAQYGYRIRANCTLCSTRSGSLTNWSNTSSFTTRSSREQNELAFLEPQMLLYPNPNKGKLYLVFQQLGLANQVELKLYDVRGKHITTQNLIISQEASSQGIPVDFGELAPGIYLLSIEGSGEAQKVKFVVE